MDGIGQSADTQLGISVVVPVLRDTDALAQLLEDLNAQSRRPDRIIVVSGERNEQISRIAREHELVLIESIASRGVQLDTGAKAADTDVLWFVHADARLPQAACETILAAVENGALGGCLRFRLQGDPGVFGKLLEWLVRFRIACGGMAYGDQALFCKRAAYLDSGGFPHWPLFEEVPLVRYLQSRRSFAALSLPVFVATRRWERDGWLRRSLHNRWLAIRHMSGVPPQRLAAAYRNGQSVTETHG